MPFIAQQIKHARIHLQKNDPIMKRIIKAYGPFTAKAKSDRFGTLVSSIISQQISTAAARTIKQRLHDAVGAKCNSARPGTVTAHDLLQFDIDSLRPIGISRQKAGYLLDLAEKVADGTVNLRNLSKQSDEEIIEHLIQIKGIGKWTAQMFLIFSMGRLDVLPVDDLGIKNAIQKQYNLDSTPAPAAIFELAQPWRPYATVASWYLWRSLENS